MPMSLSDNHPAFRRIIDGLRKDPLLRDIAPVLDESDVLAGIVRAAGADPELLMLARGAIRGMAQGLVDLAKQDPDFKRMFASAEDDGTRKGLVEGFLKVVQLRTLPSLKAQGGSAEQLATRIAESMKGQEHP